MEAGRLRHRISLWARAPLPDGDASGNYEGDFEVKLTRLSERTFLKQGETVIAARLSGRPIAVFKIRRDRETRLISTDWMLREEDAPPNTKGALPAYNVRSIEIDNEGRWLTLTCEGGVALG